MNEAEVRPQLLSARAHFNRSPITPETAKTLIENGYEIFVEHSDNRAFSDEEFAAAGCKMVCVMHTSVKADISQVPTATWHDAPLDVYIVGLKARLSAAALDTYRVVSLHEPDSALLPDQSDCPSVFLRLFSPRTTGTSRSDACQLRAKAQAYLLCALLQAAGRLAGHPL